MSLRTKITIGLYLAVYLFICFVRWEIYNPIDTIKWLGTLDRIDRGFGLFCYIFLTLIVHVVIYQASEDLKPNKSK